MPASPTLAADLRALFAARLLRMFAYGTLGVVLVLYLGRVGLDGGRIGVLLALTLLGDVAISLLLTAHADRWGRRKTLVLGAALMALGGATMAVTDNFFVLLLATTIGVISPTGSEVGPFQSVEQACLAQELADRDRTRVFAWYNLVGYGASALGALAVGGWIKWAQAVGWTDLAAERAVLFAYAAVGIGIGALAAKLSSAVEVKRGGGTAAAVEVTRPPDPAAKPGLVTSTATATPPSPIPRSLLGLRESRSVVFRLSALFALDSFGGGFVLQSFVAWWLHEKFAADPATLGAIFFGTNLLSGLSGLAAVPLARRIGLINTMVWTHLPSNVLLMLVPFMPTLPLAIAMLLARHLLSQMDVPTRSSYVNAIVPPAERSAANGVTATAKQLGTALGPAIAGKLFGALATTAAPFVICGVLKSTYDLLLWREFRHHKPPEEK